MIAGGFHFSSHLALGYAYMYTAKAFLNWRSRCRQLYSCGQIAQWPARDELAITFGSRSPN